MHLLEGYIEEIIFHNEENGYTVADLVTDDELITITGSMPFLYVGENIKIEGEYKIHPTYGKQFIVKRYEKMVPKKANEIESYLASGIFKGIGEVLAKRIVKKFKDDTLDIIEHYSERLSEVKGVSKKKAKELSYEFEKQKDVREIVIFLQKFGIGPQFSARIYKEIGKDAKKRIEQNPYVLADRIQGIGFKTADRIAYELGIERESSFRIQSGLVYVLQRAIQAGHCFLPREELIDYSENILGVKKELVIEVVDNLKFDEKVMIHDDKIYLSYLYESEKNSAFKLYEMSNYINKNSEYPIVKWIDEYEKIEKIALDEKQRKAIESAIDNGITVVTGGPGTGKTTIIKGVIYILKKMNLTFTLCAPTGRAAKRMEQATLEEAKTIHRLLEIGYMENERNLEFKRNSLNPLDYDVIIVDEVSMVDISLLHALLKAIEVGTRLILVGDKDQLPSVGPGRVIADLIESDCIQTVMLDQIFRQDKNSLIALNAHRINNGEMPVIDNSSNDFFVVKKFSESAIKRIIAKLCTDNIPDKYGFEWMEDICVLTPARKGSLGVNGLNPFLKNVLNEEKMGKSSKELIYRDKSFRIGDRVMQIKNNYNIKWYKYNNRDIEGEGLYNGDIGFVDSIDEKHGVLEVVFDHEKVGIYEKINLDELELAYATTIHKSQGSEFNVVIIPLYQAPKPLLTKNLLYTAITRAKKLVILIGDERVLFEMVKNESENMRYTSFSYWIKHFYKI